MKNLFNTNGLVYYEHDDILFREYCINFISNSVSELLTGRNKSWDIHRIETSTLIPTEHINSEYSTEDYFNIGDISLRPETTAGSYEYARKKIEQGKSLPFVVWQVGKSYRNENDQVSKNVRLKEFYQMEFQCLYSETTKDDYHTFICAELKELIEKLVKRNVRIVESDRLPSYSEKTYDLEIETPHKWLEVCSISTRNDFEKNIKVLEIAFGLDRLLFINNHK